MHMLWKQAIRSSCQIFQFTVTASAISISSDSIDCAVFLTADDRIGIRCIHNHILFDFNAQFEMALVLPPMTQDTHSSLNRNIV